MGPVGGITLTDKYDIVTRERVRWRNKEFVKIP
jgi:hypothetical protein